MKRLIMLGAVSSVLFAGCTTQKTAWVDRDYADDMDVAKTVFTNGRMAQAEFKYQQAFERSFLVDDAQAIHDAGFNLATSQIRQNHVTDAVKTVDKTLDALENRYYSQSEDLHLIKAAAFYRIKKYQKSLTEARKAKASSDKTIFDEAVAFEGYNAASLKEDALLTSSIQTLSHDDKEKNNANLLELETLFALSHGQWSQAISEAQSLITFRRESGDHIAMRRGLELLAQAYNGNGQHEDVLRIRQRIKDSKAQDEEIK